MSRKSGNRNPSTERNKGSLARDAGGLAVRAGLGGPAGMVSQALRIMQRHPALAVAATALAGYAAGRRAGLKRRILPPADTKVRDAWASQAATAHSARPSAMDHRNILKRMELERRNGRS